MAAEEKFLKLCEEKGIESDVLDDEVHDVASHIGSNVNNGGLEAQIKFLLENCGEESVTNIISNAVSWVESQGK